MIAISAKSFRGDAGYADYGPIIQKLGAERYIASGIGSELTTKH